MLYIISTVKSYDGKVTSYKVFDTHSEMLMILGVEILISIIKSGEIHIANTAIANTAMDNNNLVVKDWENGKSIDRQDYPSSSKTRHFGPEYVILAEGNNSYKIIDYKGNIQYKQLEALKTLALSGKVANCKLQNTKGIWKFTTQDTYNIHKDEEFEKQIKSKYDSFIAKSALLGYKNLDFTYQIENDDVRLEKYIGSAKSIMLPSFITVIMPEAFMYSGVEEVNLNEGLKTIGKRAFANKRTTISIHQIEIPSTVQFIGQGAFAGNNKIINKDYSINTARFKLRNNETIILKQW